MENTCAPAPTNKKEYITALGKILVQEHGKKKYYQPEEVKEAHQKTKWIEKIDIIDGIELFSCWGMSAFSSHSDFDKYHQTTGESCDYVAMKTEMLSEWTSSVNFNWTEIPDMDIDASWLDFGDVFEGVLEGLGEFIAGIFE